MSTTNGDSCVSLMQGTLVRPIARYPSSVAYDTALKVAANRVQTTLRGNISAGDTIITVGDASRLVPDMLLSVDSEIVSVTSINGNNLTVVRGFDGTFASSHASGSTLVTNIDAWHHNALAAEITAIETALGPNLSNITSDGGGIISTKYIWSQSPAVSLTPGVNVITLAPVPKGINGTNTNHYLAIAGGTGTAEVVLITGGSAVSGATSGTLAFSCANSHTGAWTIGTATAGIQEAVNSLDAAGGYIRVPAGTHTLLAPVAIQKDSVTISGDGFYTTKVVTSYKASALFNFDGSANGSSHLGTGNTLQYMTISGPGDAAATNYAVRVHAQIRFWGRYLNVSQVANGFLVTDSPAGDSIFFEFCWVGFFNGNGWNILGTNAQGLTKCHTVTGAASGSVGIRVQKTGDLRIGGCSVFDCDVGVWVTPQAGETAAHIWIDSTVIDYCRSGALRLYAQASGAILADVGLVNSYTAFTQSGHAIDIQASNGGRIESLSFIGNRAPLNAQHGVLIVASSTINNITIADSSFTDTGYSAVDTYDGVFIIAAFANSPSGLTITNNFFGSTVAGYRMRAGINLGYNSGFSGPYDNLVITGNRINGCSTSAGGVVMTIVGPGAIAGGGRNFVIRDNVPDSGTLYKVTDMGGGLFLLDDTAGCMYAVTGTVAVTALQPVWKGREIYLIKTDGTGAKAFNAGGGGGTGFRNTVSLGNGETLHAIHDGTLWNLVK